MADKTGLPNFFIVGAAKAGTTSLYEYLKVIPLVFMSPIKEPHYFSPSARQNASHHNAITGWEEYKQLFINAGNAVAVGEASPSYLWDEHSAEQIKQKIPDAKIIILLRDPIERAFSHYLADRRLGWEKKEFYDALLEDEKKQSKGWGVSHLYLELGEYYKQINRYQAVFGNEAVKIVLFDDLKKRTKGCLADLLEFIGVDRPADLIIDGGAHNSFAAPRGKFAEYVIANQAIRSVAGLVVPNKIRKLIREKILLKKGNKPELSIDARYFLQEYYREDTKRLQSLLKHPLPWEWVNE